MAAKNNRRPPARQQRAPKTIQANDVKIIVQDVLNEMGISKSQADLQQIATAAAKQAVHETLMSLGLDVANPIAAQQMFTGLREVVHTFANEDFQRDLSHVRSWRKTMDNVKSKGVGTVVAILTTALVVTLWPRIREISP